jgi:mono/diheme cytochrome c family protein
LTLEGITQGKKVERETVNELDNLGCRFVPHVQAASVGQWLVIKNRDPILHAAHAYGLEQVLPQYTDALIDRAITQGINPAGKPLDWTMLRWEMTEEDLNDLIAYLKTLR